MSSRAASSTRCRAFPASSTTSPASRRRRSSGSEARRTFPMSAVAVFLSYTSQDAAAARRLCEGLRAAGIETWLDQSELRGGDAWDASIRSQIKACALFVPVISANTDARGEGYFRLEWHLGVERSQLMADDHAF